MRLVSNVMTYADKFLELCLRSLDFEREPALGFSKYFANVFVLSLLSYSEYFREIVSTVPVNKYTAYLQYWAIENGLT